MLSPKYLSDFFCRCACCFTRTKKIESGQFIKSYRNRFSEKIRNIFYPNILYFQLFACELLMLGSTRIFLQALVSVFELEPFYEDIRQYYSYLRPSRDSHKGSKLKIVHIFWVIDWALVAMDYRLWIILYESYVWTDLWNPNLWFKIPKRRQSNSSYLSFWSHQ